MSAKLGIATGRSLPEVCRDRFPRPVVIFLWIQAELIAMATDLAEFVGAALGLYLVFGIPLFIAGLLTGVLAFAILGLQAWGFRRLEATIAALVGIIVLAFGLEVFRAKPSWGAVAGGTFVPHLDGNASILLAVGILGATVMPHVIYLHSALTQKRIVGANPEAKRKIFRFELVDVMIAMGIAGIINMAMLTTAAAAFNSRGLTGVGNDLVQVYGALDHYVGAHSGIVFRDRSACLGRLVVLGWHDGGPGRDAGLHPLQDLDLPAPRDHDGAGDDRDRDPLRSLARSGPQSGLPVVRDPLRHGPAGHVLP